MVFSRSLESKSNSGMFEFDFGLRKELKTPFYNYNFYNYLPRKTKGDNE